MDAALRRLHASGRLTAVMVDRAAERGGITEAEAATLHEMLKVAAPAAP